VEKKKTKMTLYVKNLPPKISEKSLSRIFQKFGKVCSVVIANESDIKKNKAYGYVEMDDAQEATIAISRLNGTTYRRRIMEVLPATILKTKLLPI
jgi:RNA recognition motif-containing protein